ncbi:SMI1/KNR4 family protein [Pectobacterium parmentieri]|uniref:SMI1/KNR4 family protein n=1 Tax=Pectobacterium parmentieri TaxID=1905730 RepID=UPI0018E10967|nr:SMI1/KNR4 family protein [Pectobacterium parmentieri]QQA75036.1 SMI1/KNR4 family protein [Pectobacterium parmentieri]
MNINDACLILNEWVFLSNGVLIDIGADEKYSFTRNAYLSESELSFFENESKIKLPGEYKEFLIAVGSVDIFVGEVSSGIEILSPFDVKKFSKSVFENYGDDLFPNLFLTTSIPKLGYFGGFLLDDELGNNYGVFYPEIPPELWIEECDFISFNDWIVRLIEFKSKKI